MSRSSMGATILPRLFSDSTTDPLRDRWTPGKMRHVVAAAAGQQCIVVVEGLAEIDVELLRLGTTRDGGPAALIRYGWGEGATQHNDTLTRLDYVGAVIVRDTRAGHTALETYRNEVSAAISYAKEHHGAAEGHSWGRWRGDCTAYGVFVRYEPLLGNPAFVEQAGDRFYREFRREQYADRIRPTFDEQRAAERAGA